MNDTTLAVFDGIEITPISIDSAGICTPITNKEFDEMKAAGKEKVVIGLYGHLKTGGVDWIADFPDRQSAQEKAMSLYPNLMDNDNKEDVSEYPEIRCNNCYKLFSTEDDLAVLQDNGETIKGCPICQTDGYLMDMEYPLRKLMEAFKNNKFIPEVLESGRKIYRAPWGEQLVPVPNGFKLNSDWSTPARSVYVSDFSLAVLTFCEGDLSLSVSPSKDVFLEELKQAAVFYSKY